ncbi:hypothetical protein HYH02_004784 [Chlamydomonas schloesseri]|uniref:Uncharacterized protein n=1 Tax=Chlamydomonas schloesseri TaxID=2026947 RepID=A0A835WN47_9CHLO|nr:hypothetical protein HYH02_004784 [Chlamydomonas schloesseri]|eukprot:KAG2450273.1 hypothetical protein HYH02_004784 [Chlamydomonas schloesseri]
MSQDAGLPSALACYIKRAKERDAAAAAAVGAAAPQGNTEALAILSQEERRVGLRRALRDFGLAEVELAFFSNAYLDFLLQHLITDLPSLRREADPLLLQDAGLPSALACIIKRAKERDAAAAAAVGAAAPQGNTEALAILSQEERRAGLRRALRDFGLAEVELAFFSNAYLDFLLQHLITDLPSLRREADPLLLQDAGLPSALACIIKRAKERDAAAAAAVGAAAPQGNTEAVPAAAGPPPGSSDTGARDQLPPRGGGAVAAAPKSSSWWSAACWLLPTAAAAGSSCRSAPSPLTEPQPQQPEPYYPTAVRPAEHAPDACAPAAHVLEARWGMKDLSTASTQQQQQQQQELLLPATCRRRRAHHADPGQHE